MLVEEHACARCGAQTAFPDLRLWTSRERLREFTRRSRATPSPAVAAPMERVLVSEPPGAGPVETAPTSLIEAPVAAPVGRAPAISYRWVTQAHVLCPPCHAAVLANASRLHDHDRRRAWVTALAFVGLALLIWMGFSFFTPNWIAAFWRNGAGGP